MAVRYFGTLEWGSLGPSDVQPFLAGVQRGTACKCRKPAFFQALAQAAAYLQVKLHGCCCQDS